MNDMFTLTRTQLFERFANQSTATQTVQLITANRRLARDYLWRFGLFQRERGLSVWSTPSIVTFDEFLHQQWLVQLAGKKSDQWPQPMRMLSAFEARRLMRSVIESVESERVLLNTTEAARLAIDAYELEIAYDLPAAQGSDDVRRYRVWKQQFQLRCTEREWQTSAMWQRDCTQALCRDGLLQQQIILAGFEDIPPRLQQLITAIEKQGGYCARLNEASGDEAVAVQREYFCRPTDPDTEREMAVRWAAVRAQQGQRVAIVLPDLAAQRSAIERILMRVMHPSAARRFTPISKGQFNISAGEKLREQAMVSQALLGLRLLQPTRYWSLLQLSEVMHAAYLGDYPHDASTRAQLDAKWRKIGNEQWPVSKVLQMWEASSLKRLHESFMKARERAKTWASRARPSQWAECFQQALSDLQWPGSRTLDSVAWQLRDAFDNTLMSMATLDEMTGVISFSEAMQLVEELCNDAVFQPQANAQAPVQVLGMLEVSGQDFDAIWVCGVSDEQLPSAPSPNPFIARQVQEQFRLPRSSVEREWDYVQVWQKNLRQHCSELMWSCSLSDDDRALRPSALLREVSELAVEQCVGESIAIVPAPLERLTQEDPVPMSADDVVQGGVGVLALQALNPLAAFAYYRLQARPVDRIENFTTPRVHGLLVHAGLQHFWHHIGSQQKCAALDDDALQQQIEQSITAAFLLVEQREGKTLPAVWRELETQLLRHLLSEYLSIEKTRPPFTVLLTESDVQWTYKHWPFTARVDRVDIDESGQQLVIDYKTGSLPKIANWFQTPLLDPQLPFYAAALGDNVQGLCFVRIRRGDMKWSGHASDDRWGQGVKAITDWQNVCVQWQSNLTDMARSHTEGDVRNEYANRKELSGEPVRPFLRLPATDTFDEESW